MRKVISDRAGWAKHVGWTNMPTVACPSEFLHPGRSRWNLTITTQLKGKIIWTKPPRLGSILVLWGVNSWLAGVMIHDPRKNIGGYIVWLQTRWWFQILIIFTLIWGRFPFWPIFFRWVETTNQLIQQLLFLLKCMISLIHSRKPTAGRPERIPPTRKRRNMYYKPPGFGGGPKNVSFQG